MTTVTFTKTLEFVALTCSECGVDYAMTRAFNNQLRADSDKTFYCPNGHRQHYSVTTEQKLRAEIGQVTARLDQAQADATYQRERAEREERRVTAYKGQVTRVKKRVGNGICLCCEREFQNLKRHMATQHPAYGGKEAMNG